MKIKNVQIKTEGETVFLTADCVVRYSGIDTIYFKFDKKYKDFIAADASPFAAALLIPSMKLGQDLIIEGEISEKLYQGLQEIMKTVLSWNIGLRSIKIIANNLVKDNFNATKTAAFFSGGVDSFYTYIKNKESGDNNISHFILARGYDICLDDQKLWDMTCKTIEDVAEEENIEIIKVESNIRSFIDPIMIWDYVHGGCLAALGLCLRRELKQLFIASSYTHDQLFPWGSHPHIDYHWSTETLIFCHDGADTSRVEKVKFIGKNPLVQRNLRVCYLNTGKTFNCGTCDKCIRTMINLRIAGSLEGAETFPHTINVEQMKNLRVEADHGAIFHRENLAELERLNIDFDLQEAIKVALDNVSHSSRWLTKTVLKLSFLDFFYNQSRLQKLANFFRNRSQYIG